MVITAKLATLAAWTLIIFNWLAPIEAYYSALNWTGIGLAIAHLIEMVVFSPKAKQAGGSLPLHLLQLFVFGYAHTMELDKTIAHQNQK